MYYYNKILTFYHMKHRMQVRNFGKLTENILMCNILRRVRSQWAIQA